MPLWLSIALLIVMPVLAVVAAAVINLKIRFAPSRDVAAQELKGLALRVIQWICNLTVIGSLVYQVFFSNEPLTRVAVFTIVVGVAGLMFVVAMLVVTRIKNQIYDYLIQAYNLIQKTNDTIGMGREASELRMETHKVSDHRDTNS